MLSNMANVLPYLWGQELLLRIDLLLLPWRHLLQLREGDVHARWCHLGGVNNDKECVTPYHLTIGFYLPSFYCSTVFALTPFSMHRSTGTLTMFLLVEWSETLDPPIQDKIQRSCECVCLYLTVGEGHAFASQLIMGSIKRGKKLIAIWGKFHIRRYLC